MLRRLVIDGKPDYFAVVFDAPGKTFRDDWYPEYKANRASMPDDLARQIEPLHALVRAHGWPLLMVEGVEADDVIGTLAKQATAADIDTIICTSDKDLTQLVCPRVKMVNTMSNDTYDEAGVLAKFDVRPEQVLDLLTLTGDAVDNVPGVAKVGPKTAAKWLSQYGTLDNIIANAHEIGGVVGNNLREALEWLPQGKRLLTVRTDCELPMTIQELVIGAEDVNTVRAMYERFEFKQWLKDIGGKDEVPDAAGEIAKRAAVPSDNTPVAVPIAPAEIVRETVLDEDCARALARQRRSGRRDGVRHRGIEPRSDADAHRRYLAVGRARARRLHPARPSLHRRPAAARPRRARSRALRRGSPIRRKESSATT